MDDLERSVKMSIRVWGLILVLIPGPAWAEDWFLMINDIPKRRYDVPGACQLDKISEQIVRPLIPVDCIPMSKVKK